MSPNSDLQNRIPSSKEAEDALIGAALIDPEVVTRVDLPLDAFYVHRNRWIWESLRDLTNRGITPDFVTLVEDLTNRGRLAEIGGAAYLAGMIAETPSSMGAENYADIIKDKARRRDMIAIANDLAKAAFDQDAKLDGAQIAAIERLTRSAKVKGAARPLAEYVDRLSAQVVELTKNPRDVFGIPTGVLDFDEITGGIQPSEVLYIGGDPGVGKSILSVQMGLGMAKHKPGVIYSLEMSGMQVTRRIVSSIGRIETRKLRSGRLSSQEVAQFQGACEAARKLPVYLSDESYLTSNALRSDLARLKAQHNVEWFVLDYLLLMADSEGAMDEIERSAMLSGRIKRICKEFEIGGITVNSVTKDGKIRGSNQVSHDADIICMLTEHKPSYGEKPNPRIKTVTFIKGRELSNPKTSFDLQKADGGYPAFQDMVTKL